MSERQDALESLCTGQAAVFVYLCKSCAMFTEHAVHFLKVTWAQRFISPAFLSVYSWWSETNQWELHHHRLANIAPLAAAALLNLEIITTFPIISQLQGELHNILVPSFSNWRMLDVCDRYLQCIQQTSASKNHQGWKYFLLTHTYLVYFFTTSYLCPAIYSSSWCPFSV